MVLRISDRNRGESIVNYNSSISDKQKYIIKSLQMFIMMVLDDKKDENYDSFLEILYNTSIKVDELYNGEAVNECTTTELFND